jgi:hypothetical protein
MSVFYGSDSSCIADVGLFDLQITDPLLLIGHRIARRLLTPRGALDAIGDDPNYGWDVRQYALGRLAPAQIGQAQKQIAAEVSRDEEIESATVTLSFVNGGALTIQIDMIASNGPFSMTMNVSQLTTTAVFNF